MSEISNYILNTIKRTTNASFKSSTANETDEPHIMEYVWVDGRGTLRSKTRVMTGTAYPPIWNYDGSSTWQADADGYTEVNLIPVRTYPYPSSISPFQNQKTTIVLCETALSDYPLFQRQQAVQIFNKYKHLRPTFGLEQEYFIRHKDVTGSKHSDGLHYCGTRAHPLERKIVESHLRACLEANIQISGINAEVAQSQWEFQIGPCVGIDACDQLLVARFLLERIAETNGAVIVYEPKWREDENGSGCHINFSTTETMGDYGLEYIKTYINNLSKCHNDLIKCYGEGNERRLTGTNETSHIDQFTSGVGTRNTSIRIPTQTFDHGCGYFEDRRPAANINPYLATSMLLFYSKQDDIGTPS